MRAGTTGVSSRSRWTRIRVACSGRSGCPMSAILCRGTAVRSALTRPPSARLDKVPGRPARRGGARRPELPREIRMSIEKPEIDFPGGEPPTDLQITEVWEGNGAEAKAGDMVLVHYVGVAFSTGEQFDASWD